MNTVRSTTNYSETVRKKTGSCAPRINDRRLRYWPRRKGTNATKQRTGDRKWRRSLIAACDSLRYNHNDGAAMRRDFVLHGQRQQHNDEAGIREYDLHRQRNGNNAREEGRWRALKKAVFSPLKRRFVASKKSRIRLRVTSCLLYTSPSPRDS